MNLYFRLLCLLLKIPFIKKELNPLTVTELQLRTYPNDLDFNMHVNNGRYLTLMDLGRLHMLAAHGLFTATVKRKWFPVLGSAKVHFIRPLKVFQKFTLYSQVIYWDEKWIYVEQKFVYQGKLIATAILKALFVCGKDKITPEQVICLLNKDVKKPEPPQHLLQWIAAENAAKQQET